ncbi:MAG: 2-oxoacid:acceptor oxidoreductase family protein [Candidatus Heimdallarchaeaceae archaeon]
MEKNNQPINIAIIGLGGQGVITLTKLIANTSFSLGKKVCYNEVHGLSQRGGSVQSLVRVNEAINPIFAARDVDFIIGLEKMEALRYLYLAREAKPTVIISNKYELRTTSDLGIELFPESEKIDEEILKYSSRTFLFDTLGFEKIFKSKLKPVNVGVFSALVDFPELDISKSAAQKIVNDYLGRNVFLRQINKKAFNEGSKWLEQIK